MFLYALRREVLRNKLLKKGMTDSLQSFLYALRREVLRNLAEWEKELLD